MLTERRRFFASTKRLDEILEETIRYSCKYDMLQSAIRRSDAQDRGRFIVYSMNIFEKMTRRICSILPQIMSGVSVGPIQNLEFRQNLLDEFIIKYDIFLSKFLILENKFGIESVKSGKTVYNKSSITGDSANVED